MSKILFRGISTQEPQLHFDRGHGYDDIAVAGLALELDDPGAGEQERALLFVVACGCVR